MRSPWISFLTLVTQNITFFHLHGREKTFINFKRQYRLDLHDAKNTFRHIYDQKNPLFRQPPAIFFLPEHVTFIVLYSWFEKSFVSSVARTFDTEHYYLIAMNKKIVHMLAASTLSNFVSPNMHFIIFINGKSLVSFSCNWWYTTSPHALYLIFRNKYVVLVFSFFGASEKFLREME